MDSGSADWKERAMLPVLADGFLTGLLLQVAIGPVFFFILNTTIQKTIYDGLLAVLAVTLVDYFYILLAGIGVGRLLERPRIKLMMQIASSAVLAAFGMMMWLSVLGTSSGSGTTVSGKSDHIISFVSAFLLTLSSPLTIVFWTSLFTTKAIEKGYNRQQLLPFGFGAGASTAVFLSLAVVVFALLRSAIPSIMVRILNATVGTLLIAYGVVRLANGIRNRNAGSPVTGSGQ